MNELVDPNRVVYYGIVMDTTDPDNLGRIIARPEGINEDAYKKGLPTNSDDYWTNKNPFLTRPLLPIFLYQVPKKDEFVHIIYYDKNYKENNSFYIQGNFSKINEINQQPFDDMVGGLALADRNTQPNQTTSPDTGEATDPNNQGLFPAPGTVSLLGRLNSDIMLPEDGFIARINKQVLPSLTPQFNKNYSFMMLQKYANKKGLSTYSENTVTNIVAQNLNYLVEYNVYGGLGSFFGDKYSGYIEVYKISNYTKVSLSGYSENQYFEVPDSAKIGPIFRKDYQAEEFEIVIDGFNEVIRNLNEYSSVGITGEDFIAVENNFPFIYQPTKSFYEKSLGGKEVEIKNVKKFIQNIFINTNQTNRGLALVSARDTFGILTENISVISEKPNLKVKPVTVGMTTADSIYFLSHQSQIPGLLKINFQDTTNYDKNILPENFIWENVLPNTNSMVRGEKLLELLELVINFMINHVHPFHNMPPVDVAKDGTPTQEILTRLFDGYQEILNVNLRIN